MKSIERVFQIFLCDVFPQKIYYKSKHKNLYLGKKYLVALAIRRYNHPDNNVRVRLNPRNNDLLDKIKLNAV